MRITSSRACAAARSRPGPVRRTRVSSRQHSKSSSLRGWRSQERGGSNPPFRTNKPERPANAGLFHSRPTKSWTANGAEMRFAVSEQPFVPRSALQRGAHSPCRSRTEFPSGSQPYRRARRMSRDTSGRVEPADPRWRERWTQLVLFWGGADSTTTITIGVPP